MFLQTPTIAAKMSVETGRVRCAAVTPRHDAESEDERSQVARTKLKPPERSQNRPNEAKPPERSQRGNANPHQRHPCRDDRRRGALPNRGRDAGLPNKTKLENRVISMEACRGPAPPQRADRLARPSRAAPLPVSRRYNHT